MKFLGMGGFELVIILVVILLIFGPKNLPKLGKAFGKTVSNLRDGMNAGKKKEVEETADEATAEEEADGATVEPAAIVGEVEEVSAKAPEAAPGNTFEKASAVKTEIAFEGTSEGVSNEAPEIAGEAFDAEAAVDEAFEQKKVRRVVKRKISSEEPE